MNELRTSKAIPLIFRNKAGNRAGAAAWPELKQSSMAQGQRVWVQCQVMLVRELRPISVLGALTDFFLVYCTHHKLKSVFTKFV